MTTRSASRRPTPKGGGRPAPPRVLVPGLLLALLAIVAIAILAGQGQNRRPESASPGGTLGPGAVAPAVALPATNGQTVDLSTFRGKQNVLLYFYEHAGWSPCEAQLVELAKARAKFQSEGTEVFAASIQDLETSEKMVERLAVDVPVLSDRTAAVARAFGIYDLPGSMGKFSTHSFWLIDKNGVVRFRQVSLEMHVPFDAVEQAVQGLKG